ncbi:uncharacterized protein J3D65DRAFT_628305 [Phyllosticta citribraziliensis]|uniref:Uncharacterized protein n=1 Tax=Phyllosticta citribraziliensis TaxID=989973 RepID=A0ABR1LMC6_9PEZI
MITAVSDAALLTIQLQLNGTTGQPFDSGKATVLAHDLQLAVPSFNIAIRFSRPVALVQLFRPRLQLFLRRRLANVLRDDRTLSSQVRCRRLGLSTTLAMLVMMRVLLLLRLALGVFGNLLGDVCIAGTRGSLLTLTAVLVGNDGHVCGSKRLVRGR